MSKVVKNKWFPDNFNIEWWRKQTLVRINHSSNSLSAGTLLPLENGAALSQPAAVYNNSFHCCRFVLLYNLATVETMMCTVRLRTYSLCFCRTDVRQFDSAGQRHLCGLWQPNIKAANEASTNIRICNSYNLAPGPAELNSVHIIHCWTL